MKSLATINDFCAGIRYPWRPGHDLHFLRILTDDWSSLSDITPSYYVTTFINSPLHVSASFIRPYSGGYFLSWSLLHLSDKPHVSCFVVHNKLSGGP
jgi:hypothetical protein